MDVNNAFLHGDLHEEVYMTPPPGLCRQAESTLVCQLHESLYGLKQAPRNWFHKFSVAIQKVGFTQSLSDYSLFTRTCGNDENAIHNLKSFLHNQFQIKALGHLKYFLGQEIARSKAGIAISQRK
ncbi:hypothetical protein L3X38_018100 [Prunus dulcis]|uniref:Reverse transcriptase Ty1/copia-type domain-containing protein n=1 Tax=Prunus dulcis TaxID=3755 RepID=A0AAD4ZBC1_PRUDU|nr:hypothetical protein L3X38_018100 [Prunus dulcis]